MAFDTSAQKSEQKAIDQQNKSAFYQQVGKYALAVMLTLAFFLVLRSIFRSAMGKSVGEAYPEIPARTYTMLPQTSTGDETSSLELPPFAAPQGSVLDFDKSQTREEGLSLHQMEPQRIARVIKGMMDEGR